MDWGLGLVALSSAMTDCSLLYESINGVAVTLYIKECKTPIKLVINLSKSWSAICCCNLFYGVHCFITDNEFSLYSGIQI